MTGTEDLHFPILKICTNVEIRNKFQLACRRRSCLPCYNITEPVLPLELNLQNNLFKLFLCDTGLLCAASMGNIQFDILSGDLSVNMGSILENVFAQELVSNGFLLRYFNKKISVKLILSFKKEVSRTD